MSNLQSLHLDSIDMNLESNIGSLKAPFGGLGAHLTSLSFDTVCFLTRVTSLGWLDASSLKSAQSWTVFRVISRLNSCKRCGLPRKTWEALTEGGLEAAAPLAALTGLVVTDMENCPMARVEAGKIVLV